MAESNYSSPSPNRSSTSRKCQKCLRPKTASDSERPFLFSSRKQKAVNRSFQGRFVKIENSDELNPTDIVRKRIQGYDSIVHTSDTDLFEVEFLNLIFVSLLYGSFSLNSDLKSILKVDQRIFPCYYSEKCQLEIIYRYFWKTSCD